MILWCNSHPPDHLYSALLKETNLLSEPLLGQEEKLCRWTQHTLQEDTCSSPSSHQHLNSNYIKFCYLLNTKQEGKPFPTIWHVVNSNFIHDSCAFRRKQVRPWPFHSRLCSVYLRAFNLLNGGFPISIFCLTFWCPTVTTLPKPQTTTQCMDQLWTKHISLPSQHKYFL